MRLKLGPGTEALQLVYGIRADHIHVGKVLYAEKSGRIVKELSSK